MGTLPPRPYRVAARFFVRRWIGAALCFTSALALTVGSLAWQLGEIGQLRSDDDLWTSGELATSHSVGGRETSRGFVLDTYDLDVSYADDAANEHVGHVAFDLLLASIEAAPPVQVKYDRNQPSRFVVSWAIEHASARWATVFFFLGAGVALSSLFLWIALRLVQQIRLVRAVAERSQEVVLALVAIAPVVVNGRRTGNTFTYRVGTDGHGVERREQLTVDEQPLYSDERCGRMVGLVSPHFPDRPYLVRDGLYPFEARAN